MNKISLVVLALTAAVVAAGCDRHPTQSASPSTPPYVSQAAPSSGVAVPPGDPSVPAADAALARPKSATDATADSALTRTERDTKMPMPGQVNDHSTPGMAKKGDAKDPVKASP